jgi:hypothetical protein
MKVAFSKSIPERIPATLESDLRTRNN